MSIVTCPRCASRYDPGIDDLDDLPSNTSRKVPCPSCGQWLRLPEQEPVATPKFPQHVLDAMMSQSRLVDEGPRRRRRDDDDDDRPLRRRYQDDDDDRPRRSWDDDDDFDDRPRRARSRYDEDDDERRPRKKRKKRKSNLGLILGLSLGGGGALVVLIIILIVVLSSSSGSSEIQGAFGPDGVFVANDRLTNQDKADPHQPECRHKLYKLPFTAGKRYVIHMSSHEFDAYLRLEDPAGINVAEDDDGGGALNAQIVYTAQQTGSYRIIATSLGRSTGNYTLTVRQQ
jgi:hypothetical protein